MGHYALPHCCSLITDFVRNFWEGLSQLMGQSEDAPPIRLQCVGLTLEERCSFPEFTVILVMLQGEEEGKKASCLTPTQSPQNADDVQTAALVPLQWADWTPQLCIREQALGRRVDRPSLL